MELSRRTLATVSLANLLLSIPHLVEPTAMTFAIQRNLQALARTLQGMLEFLAFVASTFLPGSRSIWLFAILVILGPIAGTGVLRAWNTGGDSKFFLSLLVAANVCFGATAAFAAAIPVRQVATCHTAAGDGFATVNTFGELGWLPETHYFLTWSPSGQPPPIQIGHVVREELIDDVCTSYQSLFPEADALISEFDSP